VRAARDGDRIGGAIFKRRSRLPQMVEKSEPGSFFDANATGANALLG